MKHLIQVKCPTCNDTIEINTITGKIERHFKEVLVKKPAGAFFKDSLAALKNEEESRKGLFGKLKQEKDSRMEEIKEKFKQETEKIKKSKDDIKPKNPFDLD